MKALSTIAAGAIAGLATTSALAGPELLQDPGFDQQGTFWGKFGAADFNNFFGANHASFFADANGNFGGAFQSVGVGEGLYQFDLTDVRIESNFNADFRFGLEYYAADDATKLGETIVDIDTNDPGDGLVTGDGLSYSMLGDAVAGTAFVRAIILFDNAAPLGSGQANAFVFKTSLTLVPGPGALAALALGVAPLVRRRR